MENFDKHELEIHEVAGDGTSPEFQGSYITKASYKEAPMTDEQIEWLNSSPHIKELLQNYLEGED